MDTRRTQTPSDAGSVSSSPTTVSRAKLLHEEDGYRLVLSASGEELTLEYARADALGGTGWMVVDRCVVPKRISDESTKDQIVAALLVNAVLYRDGVLA